MEKEPRCTPDECETDCIFIIFYCFVQFKLQTGGTLYVLFASNMSRCLLPIPALSSDASNKEIYHESALKEGQTAKRNPVRDEKTKDDIYDQDCLYEINEFFDNDFLQFMSDSLDDNFVSINKIDKQQDGHPIKSSINTANTDSHHHQDMLKSTHSAYPAISKEFSNKEEDEQQNKNDSEQHLNPNIAISSNTVHQPQDTPKRMTGTSGVKHNRDDLQGRCLAEKKSKDERCLTEQQKANGRR